MIGLKLLSTFFIAFCALSIIQISNAKLSGDSDTYSWAFVDNDLDFTFPSSAQHNSEVNAEMTSNSQLDLQKSFDPFRESSMALKEVSLGMEKREATLNPQSSIDQYESFVSLLKKIQQNFKANFMELNNNITNEFTRTVIETSAELNKTVRPMNSKVSPCQFSHYNRTFPQLREFYENNKNTLCDPLVDYFQQNIQQIILAVEKVRDDLKSCAESSSCDTLSNSIAVSAAFLTNEFISSTKQFVEQQNDILTSIQCCMTFRVSKVMEKYTNSLISFHECMRESDPSFNFAALPVVNYLPECQNKFPFLKEPSYAV